MDRIEAIEVLIQTGCTWAENAEEGFSRRVAADATDEWCEGLANEDGLDVETVKEVRDVWKAIDVLSKAVDALSS